MWWDEVYGCGTDAKNFEVTSGNYMPTTRYYTHNIISGTIINYLFTNGPSPLEISVGNSFRLLAPQMFEK